MLRARDSRICSRSQNNIKLLKPFFKLHQSQPLQNLPSTTKLLTSNLKDPFLWVTLLDLGVSSHPSTPSGRFHLTFKELCLALDAQKGFREHSRFLCVSSYAGAMQDHLHSPLAEQSTFCLCWPNTKFHPQR